MSNHDIDYPDEAADIVCINPRKKRVRAILRGLAAHRRLTIFELAGLDIRPAPLSDSYMRAALGSASRQPGTGLMGAAKRIFLQWQYNWCYHRLDIEPRRIVACWNGLKGHRFLALSAARRRGHTTLYLEEAPLPGRLTVDFTGINYGSSLPLRSDFYHRWLAENPDINPIAWRSFRSTLNARKRRPGSVAQHRSDESGLAQQNFIFCPLQVPGDSQITVYGDWVTSIDAMIGYLEDAAAAMPEGWHIRVKEHPGARVSFAERLLALGDKRIVLDNHTDTMEQVAASSAVMTINSSVGFESFFFDKPVLVLGHAFYAFDQLATKVKSASHLTDLLTAPENLTFDATGRNAFMCYVTERHFPIEEDIVDGKTTLDDIIARDEARDRILRRLGQTR